MDGERVHRISFALFSLNFKWTKELAYILYEWLPEIPAKWRKNIVVRKHSFGLAFLCTMFTHLMSIFWFSDFFVFSFSVIFGFVSARKRQKRNMVWIVWPYILHICIRFSLNCIYFTEEQKRKKLSTFSKVLFSSIQKIGKMWMTFRQIQ